MRRFAVLSLILLFAVALTAQTPNDPNNPVISAKARAVHASAIVIDTHADTSSRFLRDNYDFSAEAKAGHMDLPKIRAGGLGAEFFSVYVSPGTKGGYAHHALELFDGVYEQVRTHPDDMVLA